MSSSAMTPAKADLVDKATHAAPIPNAPIEAYPETIRDLAASMNKDEAALKSLLTQLAERQDRVAAELSEWRKLGASPALAEAERDTVLKQNSQLLEDIRSKDLAIHNLDKLVLAKDEQIRLLELERTADQRYKDAYEQLVLVGQFAEELGWYGARDKQSIPTFFRNHVASLSTLLLAKDSELGKMAVRLSEAEALANELVSERVEQVSALCRDVFVQKQRTIIEEKQAAIASLEDARDELRGRAESAIKVYDVADAPSHIATKEVVRTLRSVLGQPCAQVGPCLAVGGEGEAKRGLTAHEAIMAANDGQTLIDKDGCHWTWTADRGLSCTEFNTCAPYTMDELKKAEPFTLVKEAT